MTNSNVVAAEAKVENGNVVVNNGNDANEHVSELSTIRVTKVMLPTGDDDRVTLVTTGKFDTIDFNSGETKETNMFGINIYNLVNQIGAKVPYIQLADAMAMGKMINPKIISLALMNAEISIKREIHAQGELREDGQSVYTRDCIVTKITDVKTHINPVFKLMLDKLVMEEPTVVKITNDVAAPTSFNI